MRGPDEYEFADEYRARPRRRGGSARRLVVPAAVVIVGVGAAAGVMTYLRGGHAAPSTANVITKSRQPQRAAAGGTVLGPATTAPSAVAPPAGSRVQDVLRGTGTLTYRCGGGRYTLVKTSMQLFVEQGGFAGVQTGLLSWRFKNGTRVDGALVREVRTPATVSPALFKVVAVHKGDANDRATTFIVRLPESGGVPRAACTTTGKRVSVPFRTRYVFYRSALPATPAPKTAA